MDAVTSTYMMYGVGGSSFLCLRAVVLMYDLWALFKYTRDPAPEKASSLAWAAYGTALLSLLCGCWVAWLPLILASVERGRVYNDKSPLKSLKLVSPASMTGGVVLVLDLLLYVGLGVSQFVGGS
jgi:hypothetical protein